ncbi:hypothetical protein [Streptomyces sp. CB03238]|uniref:hypothetical protein n=1 Tax=Streptomyces sp. CB03238 TaxID=1907777 RepID=UPI000A1165E8|nr:hypothetical protein [Streptomyces sp. CB03238]ORT54183.1 hypothetical protein BKD26_35920 [Streptomyces sp. CB03238]
MQKYTFVCDWADYMTSLIDNRFVIVVEAEDYRKAEEKAARAALDYYPDVAEFESVKTFWGGDRGAVRVAEFYGDTSGDLVDRDCYDIIRS